MMGSISRLLRSSVIYGIGQSLSKFFTLLLLPFLSSHLTLSDYGIFGMLSVFMMVVQSVFSFGTGAAMGPLYFESEVETEKAGIVRITVAFLCVGAVVQLILIFLGKSWISQWLLGTTGYEELVLILNVSAILLNLSQPFQQVLQFQQRPVVFVLLALATAMVSAICSYIFVVNFGWGVDGLILAQTITAALTFLLYFLTLYGSGSNARFPYGRIWDLLKLGVPMMPSFMVLFVLTQGGRYLLQILMDMDAVGLYTMGYNFGFVMSIFVSAVTTAWYPFFMGYMNRQKEAQELFGWIIVLYWFGMGFVTYLFFAFAKPLTHFLLASHFESSWRVIGLIATSQFMLGYFSLLLPPLYFAKKIYMVGIVQLLAVLASIPLTHFLIGHIGIAGAALGMCISYAAMAFFVQIMNPIIGLEFKMAVPKKYFVTGACYFVCFCVLAFMVSFASVHAAMIYSALLTILYLFLIGQCLQRIRSIDSHGVYRGLSFGKD